jgi:hypothetical protein
MVHQVIRILQLLCFCFGMMVPAQVYAGDASGWRQKSSASCDSKSSIASQSIQILQTTCRKLMDKKECKDLYAEMDLNSPELKENNPKKLTCSEKEIERRASPAHDSDVLLACATGMVVDPFVELGTMIGHAAGWAAVTLEQLEECNKSIEKKKALVTAFNLDVPKLMRVENISANKCRRCLAYSLNLFSLIKIRMHTLLLAGSLLFLTNGSTFRRMKKNF